MTKQAGTKTAGQKASQKAAGASAADAQGLSPGQRTYEARRAAKAGMSLDKWLAHKAREDALATKAAAQATKAAKPAKAGKQGFFARLLERAQRPLGS